MNDPRGYIGNNMVTPSMPRTLPQKVVSMLSIAERFRRYMINILTDMGQMNHVTTNCPKCKERINIPGVMSMPTAVRSDIIAEGYKLIAPLDPNVGKQQTWEEWRESLNVSGHAKRSL